MVLREGASVEEEIVNVAEVEIVEVSAESTADVCESICEGEMLGLVDL